ncbi:hypothetical protein AAE026_08030 [Bradyrhizobium sp. DN5]|uniref:hypothetical protein n=1 Tax=Bradyrhizobium sp. DN5 TaxID=3056950 RepID=UPI003524E6F9
MTTHIRFSPCGRRQLIPLMSSLSFPLSSVRGAATWTLEDLTEAARIEHGTVITMTAKVAKALLRMIFHIMVSKQSNAGTKLNYVRNLRTSKLDTSPRGACGIPLQFDAGITTTDGRAKVRLLLPMIALVGAAPSLQAAAADSRNDVANAIVMVAVRGKAANGTTVERNGTGFVVGTSRNVVTAHHVVAAPSEGWAKTDFGLADFTVAKDSEISKQGF